ncbi:hypothetical protein TSUD_110180 [Trifolium subterraneum]|uniref:Bacterial surface antigen (D15) domain-containing protein n=1 Tax=Trifolium subterraneum TaxID=3900 RepID=A0A2Z6LYC0_TRISU|nr:hypothetical protein TSUD_110180 [Trifolium subterraneum]
MMFSLIPSNKIGVTLSTNRNRNRVAHSSNRNKPSLPKSSSSLQPSLPKSNSNSSSEPSLPKSNSSSQHSRHRSIFRTLSTAVAVSSATSIVHRIQLIIPNGNRHIKPIILNTNDGGVGGGHIGGGSNGGGGGGGGEWWFAGGGGDGDGGGGGGFWSRFFTPEAAIADESQSDEFDSHGMPVNTAIQLNKLSGFKKYKVSDITFFDRNRKTNVGSDDSFNEMITIVPGGVYTKAQLQKELESLASSGMFEKVDFEGKPNPDGTIGIKVLFNESTWDIAEKFRCINVGMMPQTKPVELDPDMTEREMMKYYMSQEKEYKRRMEKARPCILPKAVHMEVMDLLRNEKTLSARLLQKIRDRVQKWYHDEGYACAQVVNFGNLNTKEVVCEVVEGDISKLDVQFLDKLGNVVEGNTQAPVIHRQLPKELFPGNTFNIEAGKQALKNIHSLALFSNIEVNPRPDESSEGGIIVEIKVKESDHKTADVNTEWSIVPGRGGYPTLASLQPGGTVSFEHRNLQGLNRAFSGSITTSNFLNPQDDLAFKLEYAHPYFDGVDNPRNRTLRVSCFNSRKLSPVFTGGPGLDEVPPIWVDRAGVKANITEASYLLFIVM